MEHSGPHGQTDNGQPPSGAQATTALVITARTAFQSASETVRYGSRALCACGVHSAFCDKEEVTEGDENPTTVCTDCVLKDLLDVVILRGGSRDDTRSAEDISVAMANTDVNPAF